MKCMSKGFIRKSKDCTCRSKAYIRRSKTFICCFWCGGVVFAVLCGGFLFVMDSTFCVADGASGVVSGGFVVRGLLFFALCYCRFSK